jgi:hypothetical protein
VSLKVGVENLLIMCRKLKTATFVEGDYQDARLNSGHGGGDEGFRGGFDDRLVEAR